MQVHFENLCFLLCSTNGSLNYTETLFWIFLIILMNKNAIYLKHKTLTSFLKNNIKILGPKNHRSVCLHAFNFFLEDILK